MPALTGYGPKRPSKIKSKKPPRTKAKPTRKG